MKSATRNPYYQLPGGADLAASQQAQNAYLVNQLRPPVSPAYVVTNPYAGTGTLPCQTAGCCGVSA